MPHFQWLNQVCFTVPSNRKIMHQIQKELVKTILQHTKRAVIQCYKTGVQRHFVIRIILRTVVKPP
jgi:hypothetical protein